MKDLEELTGFTKHKNDKPPIIVIHGVPGIGKTTFAASFENPIFIPIEDGLGTLDVDTFPTSKSYNQLIGYLSMLCEKKHNFKTVVVDSLSAFEYFLHKQVAEDDGRATIEEIGYGRGYTLATDYWMKFLSGIFFLRDKKNMLPILIAHSEITTFQAPDCAPYNRYLIKLHKRAFSLLYERADMIIFAQYTSAAVPGEDKKIQRRVSLGQRELNLIEKPAFIAKNRFGMPEKIDFPYPFDPNSILKFL